MFWTIINWFRVRLHFATKRQIEIENIARNCEPIEVQELPELFNIELCEVLKKVSQHFLLPTVCKRQYHQNVVNQQDKIGRRTLQEYNIESKSQQECIEVITYNNGDTIKFPASHGARNYINLAAILVLFSTPVFAESRRFVIPKANRNDTTVVNNLVMVPPLYPLIIAPPSPEPAPLLRKSFSFQNNMPQLQRKEQILNPFIGLVDNKIEFPFIINNIVSQQITTKSGITTSKLIQVNPKKEKAPAAKKETAKPSKKKIPGLFAPWEVIPKSPKEKTPEIVPSTKAPKPPEPIGY